jgi:hypothetical protein
MSDTAEQSIITPQGIAEQQAQSQTLKLGNTDIMLRSLIRPHYRPLALIPSTTAQRSMESNHDAPIDLPTTRHPLAVNRKRVPADNLLNQVVTPHCGYTMMSRTHLVSCVDGSLWNVVVIVMSDVLVSFQMLVPAADDPQWICAPHPYWLL